jgi:hypothetical protein
MMALTDGLRVGMAMEEVRTLLPGWRESLPSAVLSPDRTHLFYTVDFTPPKTSTDRALRLTFDNGRLMIWGEPAAVTDYPNHQVG